MADVISLTKSALRREGVREKVRACRAAIVAAALLLVAGTSGVVENAMADEASAPWVVAEMTGGAYVRPGEAEDEPWRKLSAGVPIEEGSVIRTDAGGEVTLSNGSDRIELAANSEIELPAAAGDDGFTRVIHWIGSAFFEVGKRPDPHFEVDTPYLVAIVKGTKFTTEVSSKGASVDVTEGVVGVSTGKGENSRDLTAGQSANVSAAEPDKVAPGKAVKGGAKPADDGNPATDGKGKGNAPGGNDSPGNSGGKGKGNSGGGAKGDGKGNGNAGGGGNAGGNGNGNGGNGGGNGGGAGNGCRGNGGCHHDDDDDDRGDRRLNRDAKD